MTKLIVHGQDLAATASAHRLEELCQTFADQNTGQTFREFSALQVFHVFNHVAGWSAEFADTQVFWTSRKQYQLMRRMRLYQKTRTLTINLQDKRLIPVLRLEQ